SAAARRPPTTGSLPSASARRLSAPSPTAHSGRWWASTGLTSRACRSRTSSAGPRTYRSTPTSFARRAIWGSAWVTELDYPPTRTVDAVEVLHGETIPDPYRWLEDGADPDTRAWTERQNALTEDWLAQVPAREAVRRRLDELLSIGALSVPTPARGRYFYPRREGR